LLDPRAIDRTISRLRARGPALHQGRLWIAQNLEIVRGLFWRPRVRIGGCPGLCTRPYLFLLAGELAGVSPAGLFSALEARAASVEPRRRCHAVDQQPRHHSDERRLKPVYGIRVVRVSGEERQKRTLQPRHSVEHVGEVLALRIEGEGVGAHAAQRGVARLRQPPRSGRRADQLAAGIKARQELRDGVHDTAGDGFCLREFGDRLGAGARRVEHGGDRRRGRRARPALGRHCHRSQ
jgi:hypothetical protein